MGHVCVTYVVYLVCFIKNYSKQELSFPCFCQTHLTTALTQFRSHRTWRSAAGQRLRTSVFVLFPLVVVFGHRRWTWKTHFWGDFGPSTNQDWLAKGNKTNQEPTCWGWTRAIEQRWTGLFPAGVRCEREGRCMSFEPFWLDKRSCWAKKDFCVQINQAAKSAHPREMWLSPARALYGHFSFGWAESSSNCRCTKSGTPKELTSEIVRVSCSHVCNKASCQWNKMGPLSLAFPPTR